MADKHRVSVFLKIGERAALELKGNNEGISGNMYAKKLILEALEGYEPQPPKSPNTLEEQAKEVLWEIANAGLKEQAITKARENNEKDR